MIEQLFVSLSVVAVIYRSAPDPQCTPRECRCWRVGSVPQQMEYAGYAWRECLA
jgi:hypothetical protein